MDNQNSEIDATRKALFGDASLHDIAKAAGTPAGGHATFRKIPHGENPALDVTITHPNFNATRLFHQYKDRHGNVRKVMQAVSQKATGHLLGHGYQRFAESLPLLHGLGVTHVEAFGEGHRMNPQSNGHYTWPRFGFNATIPKFALKELSLQTQAELAKTKPDFHSLFDTKFGGEEWRKLGISAPDLTFDVHPDSEHSKRFWKYYNERHQQRSRMAQNPTDDKSTATGGSDGSGGVTIGAPTSTDSPGLDQRLARSMNGIKRRYRRKLKEVEKFAERKTGLFKGATESADEGKSRTWEPKYPEIAVSPEQGLHDDLDNTGNTFEPSPSTSHVAGWKLNGGGFIKKFYAPSVKAPDKTNTVLSVRFKNKKSGGVESEYEYYFTDEAEANNYITTLRGADHPGHIVNQLIRLGVPYKRKYHREGTVERYAAGDVHPLYRGFRIEHVLNHLRNDPKASDTVKALASSTLTEGPHVLPILHDALDDEGHDFGQKYNFRGAEHKIHLDDAVGHVLRAISSRIPNERLGRIPVTPDNHALALLTHLHKYGPEELQVQYGTDPFYTQAIPTTLEAYNTLRHSSEASSEDITGSLDRHALRRIDESYPYTLSELNEQIMNPDLKTGSFYDKKRLNASKYNRLRKAVEKYAKVQYDFRKLNNHLYNIVHKLTTSTPSPDRKHFLRLLTQHIKSPTFYKVADNGKVVYNPILPSQEAGLVNGSSTPAHAHSAFSDYIENLKEQNKLSHENYKDLRGRVDNLKSVPVVIPHPTEPKRTIVDPGYVEKPISFSAKENFARPKFGDFVSALRRARSQQQDALKQIATNIHNKLKMKTLSIRSAVHDTPTSSSSNTAQSVEHNDPAKATYAAASYGLVSQSPSLLVFHVGDGPDSVYKLSVKGSGEKLRSQLDDAGLHQRTFLPTDTGYDVVLYDKDSHDAQKIYNFAANVGSKLKVNRGVGEIIGDENSQQTTANQKSRRNYRSIIRKYEGENARTQQQPVSNAVGNGANSGAIAGHFIPATASGTYGSTANSATAA